MPARRLPWVKLWPELMEREKVRRLTDSQYRTWTYCLLAGSQQPTRWRFNSLEHAAYVTRRPLKDVRALAEARFLDSNSDGVWIHDAHEYQDVAPSDISRDHSSNDDPSTDDRPPNGGGTVVESSVKGRGTLGEDSANARQNSASRTRGERGEGRGEIEKKMEIPPAASQQPPTAFSDDEQVRIDQVRAVLVPMGLDGRPEFWRKVLDTYGGLDLEAEAFKQADWLRRNKKRQCSELRYLNWLDIAARKAPHATAQRGTQEDQTRFAAFRKYA